MTTAAPSARERLLAAADELFYDEGVHVGIDRVIARAGVAKASLYNTFGSKEALVEAYLLGRHRTTAERLTRGIERYDTPRDRLLGVFTVQGELFSRRGFRGCAFASATTECPPDGPVAQAADGYRSWLRGLLMTLAAEAGAADPAALAHQLHVLYDGAALSARMDRDPSAAHAARTAAAALLEASTA